MAATFVLMSAVSYEMVRRNERDQMHGDWDYRKSFVLRRAEVAERAYHTVTRAKDIAGDTDTVVMVYGRPGRAGSFNIRNIVTALGRGSAIRLFYEDPRLEVQFTEIDVPIDPEVMGRAHIYRFDDFGTCTPMQIRPKR